MRKSYSLFLRVTLKKGVADVTDDDDEWEVVEPIKSMWQRCRVLRVKWWKARLNRLLGDSLCREGSVLVNRQSPDKEGMVNATLAMGIRPTQCTTTKFKFYSEFAVHKNFIWFWDWGRWQKARIDSQWYMNSMQIWNPTPYHCSASTL